MQEITVAVPAEASGTCDRICIKQCFFDGVGDLECLVEEWRIDVVLDWEVKPLEERLDTDAGRNTILARSWSGLGAPEKDEMRDLKNNIFRHQYDYCSRIRLEEDLKKNFFRLENHNIYEDL